MLRLITGAMAVALTVPALADQPSFNFVNGSFQDVEFDIGGGVDIDGDGFGIGGSYQVADNWHIIGEYSAIGFDFSVDLNRLVIGGGYHTAISDTTSFFADLTWQSWEFDTGNPLSSSDDDGYGITIGVRSNVSDRLELAGTVSAIDLGDAGDTTAFGGAAWYDFESFALGVTAEFGEDISAFGIGGRFYFDP